jgi:phage gp36-like protein
VDATQAFRERTVEDLAELPRNRLLDLDSAERALGELRDALKAAAAARPLQ